jgi:hypothetical protein
MKLNEKQLRKLVRESVRGSLPLVGIGSISQEPMSSGRRFSGNNVAESNRTLGQGWELDQPGLDFGDANHMADMEVIRFIMEQCSKAIKQYNPSLAYSVLKDCHELKEPFKTKMLDIVNDIYYFLKENQNYDFDAANKRFDNR